MSSRIRIYSQKTIKLFWAVLYYAVQIAWLKWTIEYKLLFRVKWWIHTLKGSIINSSFIMMIASQPLLVLNNSIHWLKMKLLSFYNPNDIYQYFFKVQIDIENVFQHMHIFYVDVEYWQILVPNNGCDGDEDYLASWTILLKCQQVNLQTIKVKKQAFFDCCYNYCYNIWFYTSEYPKQFICCLTYFIYLLRKLVKYIQRHYKHIIIFWTIIIKFIFIVKFIHSTL